MKKILVLTFIVCSFLSFSQNLTGTWTSSYGELRLIQEGNRIYGDYADKGVIDATIEKGGKIIGRFTNKAYPDQYGELSLVLNGYDSFIGSWRFGNGSWDTNSWTAKRLNKNTPILQNNKRYTGQYESNFNTKTIFNIEQKGLRIEGKSFDDKYTLSIYLKPDLMHFRDGFIADKANNSLQANHQITSGSPKHRDQFPAQIWNFWIEKGTNKKSYYMKFIKPMSVAEFKSATYGTAKLSNNSQEFTRVKSLLTSNSKDLRYRLTLDRIYIEGVEDGPEGIFSGYELYGIAWCRAYDSNGKQIKPFDVTYSDPYGRFWEIKSKDYIRTDLKVGAQYEIDKKITFDIPLDGSKDIQEVLKKSKIELTVELKDYDSTSSNDILGKERIMIPLNEAPIQKMPYNNSPKTTDKGVINIKHGTRGHIMVTFYIEKID
ncbi:hypothetical protein [Flavobacterium sp. U410]